MSHESASIPVQVLAMNCARSNMRIGGVDEKGAATADVYAQWGRDATDPGRRSQYYYGSGQWPCKEDNGDFTNLGASWRSSGFVVTDAAEELGDGWWFVYYLASDNAY